MEQQRIISKLKYWFVEVMYAFRGSGSEGVLPYGSVLLCAVMQDPS